MRNAIQIAVIDCNLRCRANHKNIFMARSIRKGPFFEGPTRRSTILPHCVDKTYIIENGQHAFEVLITEDMIGHKFGEFVRTKKKALHIKKKS